MFSDNCVINNTIFDLAYGDSISALSRASMNGDLKTVKSLLMRGKLPQSADNRGWTAIHFSVAAKQLETLKLILRFKTKSKKYLVNLKTWENVTPLLLSLKADSPSLEMVKFLLKMGADCNSCTNTGLSPLHLACSKKRHLEFAKLLIQNGANANAQEDLGHFTPLHFAVTQAKDLELIEYLIEVCDISLKNSLGKSPFLEACQCNYAEAVNIFLKKSAKLNFEDEDIHPILYACYWGNVEIVRLLLESLDVSNLKCRALVRSLLQETEAILLDVKNYLPIHSSLNNIEVFEILLKFTDPNVLISLDPTFNFPVFIIIHSKNNNFFEILLQSDLPNELKTITSKKLINYILKSPRELSEDIFRNFKFCFRYSFYLEPDDLFQSFLCMLSNDEVIKNFKYLHKLAEMGISSSEQFSNKLSALQILEKSLIAENKDSENYNLFLQTCNLLREAVLSLKQLSRIVARRHIRSFAKNDWEAYLLLKNSDFPDSLKSYLFFDIN